METIQKQSANITIRKEMVEQLYHVNYLVAYPVSDLMLEGWARSISELMPDVTEFDIKRIIDEMKVGKIKFDSRKGVQNILIALKSYPRKSQLSQSEW